MQYNLFLFSLALLLASCSNSPSPSSSQIPVETENNTEWIDINKIQKGDIKHDSLSKEQVVAITHLHKVFSEVDPTPLESWMEDFQRDADPDREIAIWNTMAGAFEDYCQGKELNLDEKEEVYMLVLLRSSVPAEEVLKNYQLKHLSNEEALKVINSYKGEVKPVRVIQGNH